MKSMLKASIAVLTIIMSTYIGIADDLQYFRPNNQDGNLMFETPALDDTPFNGFKVQLGGNFAQQLQLLTHENSGAAQTPDLYDLANGFNLATANLNIWAQLDDGVLLALEHIFHHVTTLKNG